MTTTYDLTDNIGKIRLAIGDRDITNAFYTDEELTVFYDAEGSINLAAAAALEAWASAYAANADSEHIGDYSYTQSITSKMLSTAQRLRDSESNKPASDWAEMDLENYGDTEEDAG